MALNGADVLIYIGANLVAGQRDVTQDETTEVIDASSKDSRNRRVLPGRYGSTLSLEALYIPDDAAYIALVAAKRAGTFVTVVVKEEGANIEQASAIISALSKNSPDQDVTTISATFEIDGAWVELGT
jgi:predicted secreted protein